MWLALAAHTVLVLWVVASELSSPGVRGLRDAAHDVLGRDCVVQVRSLHQEGEFPEAEALPDTANMAKVTWTSPLHQVANVQVYLPSNRRWVRRAVSFGPEDPQVEKGRTLGFLIASILVDAGLVPSAKRPSPKRSLPPSVPLEPTPEVRHREELWELSAAAEGATSGGLLTWGAWASGHRWMSPRIALGLGASGRYGSLPAAQASMLVVNLSAATMVRFWRPSAASWLGVVAQAGVTRLSVSHFSDDDPSPDVKDAYFPLLELAGRAELRIGASTALFLDIGVADQLGTAEVYVRGKEYLDMGPVLLVGRAGFSSSL